MMPRKGFKHSESTKRKISEKASERLKLKWKEPEFREKMLPSRRGCRNGFWGKKHTDEFKEKMRQKMKGKTPWNKGLSKEIDPRIKVVAGFKGKHHDEETRKKISENIKAAFKSEEKRKRLFERFTDDVRKRLAELARERFKDKNKNPVYRPEVRRKISEKKRGRKRPDFANRYGKKDEFEIKKFQAEHIRPTKLERRVKELLEEILPNEYIYVGDGLFVLGGYCPDFLNRNGKKKLIEVFGDYWHRNDNPEERKAIFRKYGFDCLIIWEHELNDIESLRQKILQFNNGVSLCQS
jgi:hypothetical protein